MSEITATPSLLGPLRDLARDNTLDAELSDDVAAVRREVGEAPTRDPWPD